jgi:hypothetical protein
MPQKAFQEKFNRLFEENMAKEVSNKNDWFSKEDPLYQIEQGKNIDLAIKRAKEQAKQHGVILYRGVGEITGDSGNGLYDDDGENQDYVSSNPFSKLKYDDLRKVHKDQTVFSVSESDFDSVEKYRSVEELNRVRGVAMNPLDEASAKRALDAKELAHKEAIMKKEYMAKLESLKYQEKNKSVLSRFLQLGH